LALRFVIGLGLVSLFADFTYEGGRSITGPFLAVLGASPLLVGVVAGVGEFVGYLLRLLSGRYVDRSGRHWPAIYLGYAVNLLALPLLSLVGGLAPAAGLIFAERLGKGVRTPARDAVLSRATRELGQGFAFGLHETLDQIGALLGPLVVAGAVVVSGYRLGFAVLVLPALAALTFLWRARGLEPEERALTPGGEEKPFPPTYRSYLLFTAVGALGFTHFLLLAYHLEVRGVVGDAVIPLLFALAMGVDALSAFLAGRAFDRYGLKTLYLLPILSLPAAPLAFLTPGVWGVALGVGFWGAALGMQESVMRAAVASLSPSERRGSAYGAFDATFGSAWMLGSFVMGALYGLSPLALVIFSLAMQLLSLLPLMRLRRLL